MKTLVIGSPGVGKTTFAKQLQKQRQVPLLHLDRIWHKGDYSDKAKAAFMEELSCFMANETAWIIEGNYADSLSLRLQEADQVIWLKESPYRCLYRVLKRSFCVRWAGQIRSEMPKTFQEKYDKEYFNFLTFVWHFPTQTEPKIADLLSMFDGEVLVLEGNKQVQSFLKAQANKSL